MELVRIATLKERRAQEKVKLKTPTKADRIRDELFEELRALRRKLAQQKGVPPYIIFSDATLEEMAAAKPVSDAEMKMISGVGDRKLQLYGDVFMRAIIDYQAEKGNAKPGSTQRISYELYQQGKSIEEIAIQRDIQVNTIYSHLASCYLNGENLAIEDLVSQETIETVEKALPYLEKPVRLKALYEMFDGQVDYGPLRLALTHLQKTGVYQP